MIGSTLVHRVRQHFRELGRCAKCHRVIGPEEIKVVDVAADGQRRQYHQRCAAKALAQRDNRRRRRRRRTR